MPSTFRAYIHDAAPTDERAVVFIAFARTDPTFPDASSWPDLREYLKRRRVGRAAIKDALSAWRDYEASGCG